MIHKSEKSIEMKRLSIICIIIGFGFFSLLALSRSLYPQGVEKIQKIQPLSKGMEKSLINEQTKPVSHSFGSVGDLIQTYVKVWGDLQEKIEGIKKIQEENIQLRKENAKLKIELESTRFQKSVKKNVRFTHENEKMLRFKTGSKVGAALESLNYQYPKKLAAPQLFTLGVSYLKAHENEKVAAIFSALASGDPDVEGSSEYQTAPHYLVAGIAWYRLENYFMANYYFNEVLKQPEQANILHYLAQARLWKAHTSYQLKKKEKVQYWLKELVDHHPYSKEAAWVNFPKKQSKKNLKDLSDKNEGNDSIKEHLLKDSNDPN